MFSNKALKGLIIPLFIDQLLAMLVGLADTFIVSSAGEAAVSGVSLVNSLNTIFIFLFGALSSGGAVIISQYIGSGRRDMASRSASQLFMFSVVFSTAAMALILLLHKQLLGLLYSQVEPAVMQACTTYILISTCSFPALAVYNAGAALCRASGNAKVTMYISTISNIINVGGNIIGVLIMKAGVAGVAWPTLISRVFSAVAVTIYCFSKKCAVPYVMRDILVWDSDLLKRVLGVAVPNGVESGTMQIVKVITGSLVSTFGTYQIAANGVAQTIWGFSSLMNFAMAPVFTTVIGQCMGAQDIDQADMYFKKLMKISLVLSICWNGLVALLMPVFIQFFNLSQEAKDLIIIMVLINNAVNSVFYPFSGPLGSGLRAAGDIRYTMIVAIIAVIGRLIISIAFGMWLGLGAIGIALGMGVDTIIKAVVFFRRYRAKKWTQFRLI